MKSVILSVLLVLASSNSYADDDLWRISLGHGNNVVGCNIDSVSEQNLFLSCGTSTAQVSVDSIFTLRFEKSSGVGRGILYGALGGMVTGAALGYLTTQGSKNQLLGPDVAALAGGAEEWASGW